MSKKCLYCYKVLEKEREADFHERCSLHFFGSRQAPVLKHSLGEMAELAKGVVERSVAVPGVQPKLSLSLVKDVMEDGNRGRLTVVGALGGNYIFKPPSDTYREMPQTEHVTMRVAEAFGINTVRSSLIRLQSGELGYITRRIDRAEAGEKIHMIDMYQITEALDKYKSSMEKIGKALAEYSGNPLLDMVYFFELTVFSFLAGNNDMHLKNFSMIKKEKNWILAPAYDLLNVNLVNPADDDELALPIRGEKKRLKKYHFELFGKDLGLNDKQVEGVFKRFTDRKPIALDWISNSFLSEPFKIRYKEIIEERYERMAR